MESASTPPRPLAELRAAYEVNGLTEASLAGDWLTQLQGWLQDAMTAGIPEPNAMTLATVDAEGRPSSRTVLLRGLDDRGLIFYTNRTSRKGQDLRGDPRAALTIPWVGLGRQVCVTGNVEEVTRAETEAYARARPRGSQIGAWASRQSQVIASRAELDVELAAVTARFAGQPVPVPEFWGGYRVLPLTVEFWLSQPSRLHDRLRFRRADGTVGTATDGRWYVERLSP